MRQLKDLGLIIAYELHGFRNSNFSILGNIGIGIAGGVVGSLILSVVGLYGRGFIGNIIVSVIGACVLIAIVRAVKK